MEFYRNIKKCSLSKKSYSYIKNITMVPISNDVKNYLEKKSVVSNELIIEIVLRRIIHRDL